MATIIEKEVSAQGAQQAAPALPPTRLLTVADFAVLPDELPTGPVRYELDDGRLLIMTPPGDIHGAAEAHFAGEFLLQLEKRGLGKVRCGEVSVVLRHNPDRVVGADVVFIANSSLPIRRSPEGYLETIPDLVVEVRSKNDSHAYLLRKTQEYLDAGVKLVWIADPEYKTVTAYRKNREAEVFAEDAILRDEAVVPGFQAKVSDLFQL